LGESLLGEAYIPDGRIVMRDKIKMVSSAGTGYFYTTSKNKKLSTEKLRLKKYDPKVRKHVEFVEEKMR
jgi:large subunit ribosomal protein L33